MDALFSNYSNNELELKRKEYLALLSRQQTRIFKMIDKIYEEQNLRRNKNVK